MRLACIESVRKRRIDCAVEFLATRVERPRLRAIGNRWCGILLSPGDDRAQPHGRITKYEAAKAIDDAQPTAAVFHEVQSLPFKTGECSVASEEPDNEQKTPIRAEIATFREERHRKTD
jgi:hypothetical protein